MLFSSIVFVWVFLPLVFAGNFICQKIAGNRLANLFLLLASILFYAWGEPVYVLLMLFSITFNWVLGYLVRPDAAARRVLLVIAIVLNLSLLGLFKYSAMLVKTINRMVNANLPLPQITLPIGISFFTFQALSYVVDVYRGECEVQRNWAKLALYISFFPQLIAGPIVKYRDISEQLDHRAITPEKTALGIRRFVYGFAKKVLVANTLAYLVDQIYEANLSSVSCGLIWLASIAYSLQIYYDFSGYSDMAIGLGRMFGFDFEENFRYPYQSRSIREFWRRWHISLSSWFRDYLYIPLGGNRKGTARTYLNLMIVFFCTGLWHGAGWTFVLWGLYHGLFSIVERVWLEKSLRRHRVLSHVYTLLVVNFGWVMFRVGGMQDVLLYFGRMLSPWVQPAATLRVASLLDHYTLIVLICGLLGCNGFGWLAQRCRVFEKLKYSPLEVVFCLLLFFLSIMSLASGTYNPFIYFRF